MSIATIEAPPKTAWPRRRWTTAEFDALLADGYLKEGSKTFLWDGDIFDPMPENEPHALAQDSLYKKLLKLLPDEEWTTRPAHPLALRDGYKPQPDLVVLPGTPLDYLDRVPEGKETALVVEVADTSYPQDSDEKSPEYAKAGIARYWIVHLRARRIETYSRPDTHRYTVRQDYALESSVPLLLERGGEVLVLGEIPVMDVFRYSLGASAQPA